MCIWAHSRNYKSNLKLISCNIVTSKYRQMPHTHIHGNGHRRHMSMPSYRRGKTTIHPHKNHHSVTLTTTAHPPKKLNFLQLHFMGTVNIIRRTLRIFLTPPSQTIKCTKETVPRKTAKEERLLCSRLYAVVRNSIYVLLKTAFWLGGWWRCWRWCWWWW